MFNYRVVAIIKREIVERLKSKAFIVGTVALPGIFVLMFGIMYLASSAESEQVKIEVISDSKALSKKLENMFNRANLASNGFYDAQFNTVVEGSFDAYLDEVKPRLVGEELDGVLYIPSTALTDKGVRYYSKNPRNIILHERLKIIINPVLLDQYFSAKKIPMSEIDYAVKQVEMQAFKISDRHVAQADQEQDYLIAFIFATLLYACIITMGSLVMQSVIREKSDRVVEILLSSVTGKELMTGKILASTIAGVAQMTVWMLPGIVIAGGIASLPFDISLNFSGLQIAYYGINFIVGLLTFISLFAAVGSIYDTPEDAQTAVVPLTLLLVVPLVLSTTLLNNSSNPIAEVASMMPISAIILMPVRMSLVEVPLWQVVISAVVNIATLLAMLPISGKIYRIGILMTGKPKWRDVYRWIKN